MSAECERCGQHCLDCKPSDCANPIIRRYLVRVSDDVEVEVDADFYSNDDVILRFHRSDNLEDAVATFKKWDFVQEMREGCSRGVCY